MSHTASEWDDYAAGWDSDEHARAYAAAAFDSLQRRLADPTASEHVPLDLSAAHVLDFGCGTGLLTERLAHLARSVVAVDTSRAMLDVLDAKIEDHAWTNVATSGSLPRTPDSFDVIVCSSVCSFLPDYPATAVTLAALLRPGGLFVQWDWERDDGDEDGHGFSRAEIAETLTAAGLEHVEVATGFRIPAGDDEMAPLMGTARAPSR